MSATVFSRNNCLLKIKSVSSHSCKQGVVIHSKFSCPICQRLCFAIVGVHQASSFFIKILYGIVWLKDNALYKNVARIAKEAIADSLADTLEGIGITVSNSGEEGTISSEALDVMAEYVMDKQDEIKEKLVAIGELLGFESRSEVRITAGAVVDAVWEAKIGNMGKAIYVFEVQSKGSIDSLILNLKKAQSNAAVQAVVAVADEEQLAKICRESMGVIDKDSLRTWDSDDVLAVYDSLTRAHESINKLKLVPESF